MDIVLQLWVALLTELARVRGRFGAGTSWQPGERLRLLFAGYNGVRNTGSDVRVEEMLRQVRTVLGEDNLDLTVMTQDPTLTRGYFGNAAQVLLPNVFPPFLYREVPRHHGLIACEGSMFKSTFANALSTMMIGSLGIASARNRLSIGYGAEAGKMDASLERLCRRYCHDSLIVTRNAQSAAVLRNLDIAVEEGTDTGWTFEPLPAEYGRKALTAAGWDGSTPVLGVCVINPFWWPVKPSLLRLLALRLFGAYHGSHYRSLYFHRAGPGVDRAYRGYLAAMASGIERFRQRHHVFPVLIAMERLDGHACRQVAKRLGGAPVFSSAELDMYQLVSILRSCDMLISSRYHGILTSMPALVPSAGVTMDERIRNLMADRGHRDLVLDVGDPDLADKVFEVLCTLRNQAECIRDGMGRSVARNLETMARMGVCLQEQVQRHYPEFPMRQGVHGWEDYLPPLGPGLQALLERYA